MASGSGGQIAVISVGSLFQAASVSSAMWTNFVSETIEHHLNELQEGSITGYKDAPPSWKGADYGQGDIQFEPNPDAIGNFMRAVFGQSSGSVLVQATSTGANSLYSAAKPVVQHTFLPIQNAVDTLNFLPIYALAIYKDVGSAFIFEGGVLHTMEFQIQAGQLAKSTVGGMFRNVTRTARTSSMQALVNPGGRPWVWDMASIQVGPGVNSLAAKTNYESMTIKIDIPIEGVLLLDGTKKYGEFQVNGFRQVTIQGTMSFRDQAEYDNFVAYADQYMRVNLTHVSSQQILGNPSSAYYNTLQLDIPLVKYTSWSTPIGGPNRLVSQFQARASFDTTSLYMIKAQLTNTTSAYL